VPIATVFVLLALLEIGVRVAIDNGMNFDLEMWKYAQQVKQRSSDPLIGHEHRPHAHAHLMGVDIDTNSVGHRDREIPFERRPGVPRILMLGDSLIEGWGVPFDQTISKRLEALFARTGRTVEVMNTGVGNYGSVQQIQAFLTRDAHFNPDIVVLNFFVRAAIAVPRYQSDFWLTRHSEALVFLTAGSDALGRLLGARKRWDEDYLSLFDGPGWPAAKAAIHRLAGYCRDNGIKLVVVNWPEMHDVQHYRLGRITQLGRNLADEEHAPFVDLLEAVKDTPSPSLWVTKPDPHPNGYANMLFAQYLFPILEPLVQEHQR
jgi:lysophospholipase L1-like esterase